MVDRNTRERFDPGHEVGGLLPGPGHDERLVVVAMQRQAPAVDVDHLDHPAPSRDRAERVRLPVAGERESVGVGMRVADVHRLDPYLRAGLAKRCTGARQPWVGRIPAEQAAEEPHVGPLRLMRGGQRSGPVELHEHVVGGAADEVAGEPTDPQGGRAVRTRGPPHHGADHVVENAHQHHSPPAAGAAVPTVAGVGVSLRAVVGRKHHERVRFEPRRADRGEHLAAGIIGLHDDEAYGDGEAREQHGIGESIEPPQRRRTQSGETRLVSRPRVASPASNPPERRGGTMQRASSTIRGRRPSLQERPWSGGDCSTHSSAFTHRFC